jgi:DNA-binding transcriptional ArsR family regulator
MNDVTGRGPFSPQLAEAVADVMFALSTPSRVRILGELQQGPRTVSELMEAVEMEQSAVSHQLRILREHGLVSAVRDGRRRVYALHDEHVATLLLEAVQHIADRTGAPRRARRGGAA